MLQCVGGVGGSGDFGGRVGDKKHAKCRWGALETIG